LFGVAPLLEKIGIRLILIQIHEAHSDAWPIGLVDQPKANSCYQDRVDRAQQFLEKEQPPYDIYIDGWDDIYEQTFRAWPDRYFYVDMSKPGPDIQILATSTYGQKADALVDYECRDLVHDILTSHGL